MPPNHMVGHNGCHNLDCNSHITMFSTSIALVGGAGKSGCGSGSILNGAIAGHTLV